MRVHAGLPAAAPGLPTAALLAAMNAERVRGTEPVSGRLPSHDLCRSCALSIAWGWTVKGKRIPLDRDPVEDGNLALSGRGDHSYFDVYVIQAVDVAKGDRYVSHFATCPRANDHRGRSR